MGAFLVVEMGGLQKKTFVFLGVGLLKRQMERKELGP